MPLVSTKDDISKYLFLSERGREMDHYKMDDSVLASDWSIQFCCSSHAKIHSIVTAMMWKVSLLTRCRLKWFEFDWFYVVDQCGHLLCSVHLTVRSTLKQRDTSKMCIKKKKKRDTKSRKVNRTVNKLPHQCCYVSLDLEWVPLPPLHQSLHLPGLYGNIKK